MNFGDKKSFTIKKKLTIGDNKPSFTIGKKKPAFTINPSKKVKDIPAFHQGTSIPIETRDDLKEVVEEPCLKACQILFDKNIKRWILAAMVKIVLIGPILLLIMILWMNAINR